MLGSIKFIFLEGGVKNIFVLMIMLILWGILILIYMSRYIEHSNAIQLLNKESI